jgi:hypothetical protein
MHLDKSKKRIAKKVKMGFQGYPTITIAYHGPDKNTVEQVSVQFVAEEGQAAQTEKFNTKGDTREDEVIQSAIVKMIERSGALTVFQIDEITPSKD